MNENIAALALQLVALLGLVVAIYLIAILYLAGVERWSVERIEAEHAREDAEVQERIAQIQRKSLRGGWLVMSNGSIIRNSELHELERAHKDEIGLPSFPTPLYEVSERCLYCGVAYPGEGVEDAVRCANCSSPVYHLSLFPKGEKIEK